MCPINGWGRPEIKISYMCVDAVCFPLGRLMVVGFVATRMLFTGAQAVTKNDVAPVSAIACVGSRHIAFARCGVTTVQLEAMTVVLLS